MSFEPIFTPRGQLTMGSGLAIQHFAADGQNAELQDLTPRLTAAFERGHGEGLLQLGAGEVTTPLPAAWDYWRDFAARFVSTLCAQPESPHVAPPPDAFLEKTAAAVPPMAGAEYVTPAALRALWTDLDAAFAARLADSGASVQDVLRTFNAAWNTVGRVHFHLAENRRDPDAPFAFLATYTHALSAQGKARHVPLGRALEEYGGAANRGALLSLLVPVQRAAERCAWLEAMVERGEIFHPLRWTPAEALAFLRDVHPLEDAGVIVRVPAHWKAGRPPRPTVVARVGAKPAASGLGLESLLDFSMEVTLDGERLTPAEIRSLLRATEGLAFLRGRWVEIDGERLGGMIDRFSRIEQTAARQGLTFAEAMRLVAGADTRLQEAADDEERAWAGVEAGPWLAGVLQRLRSPDGIAGVDPGDGFHGSLRPYQQVGVRWLHFLSSLGLGACLADDMGLGKTVQVLALLLVLGRERAGHGAAGPPHLLVAPASVLANWAAEIARFAPGLSTFVAHPSAVPAAELKAPDPDRLAATDVVLTTYGTVRRLRWVGATEWDLVVLDEAQAIKNPAAQQSRAVKALRSRARIVLTGTPVENRLGDLWSLFDFLNPGLLGSARQFTEMTKRMAERPHNAFGPLRDLVRPYILRRLKTDPRVIADLPEKTEMTAYCLLSRVQAALYEQAVRDLKRRLDEKSEGIERRGLVLASLLRLKQICNHPSQWLGDQAWGAADSGKWARLAEIVDVVSARQEKLLVFTQFREITGPLATYLAALWGRPGLVLHGGTPVRARRQLVERFQEDERVPFFVLSLKAGGTGLNLTAASHVVHVDRWWNPAVEDQATDRAFRIGQTRNVLVHKFVCRGTVEERIDELIASKRGLARDVLEGGAELLLTEMPDDDLLRLVALDARAAMGDRGQ
jgi:non-specific serine/threonine protein kinase